MVGPAVDSGLPAIVTYQGDSGEQRSLVEILRDLHRLLPGDIGYGHLHAHSEIVSFLSSEKVCGYFLLRDPRDVVVSHAHYITEMEPNHILHQYYTQQLKTLDERIRVSIQGLPESLTQEITRSVTTSTNSNPASFSFPDIQTRFAPYLDWLESQSIRTIRFEQFVNNQAETISQVVEYAEQHGFPVIPERSQAIQAIISHLNPKRSPTFRQGRVGSWRKAFSPDNIRLFKDISGDLLIMLGYESNQDW